MNTHLSLMLPTARLLVFFTAQQQHVKYTEETLPRTQVYVLPHLERIYKRFDRGHTASFRAVREDWNNLDQQNLRRLVCSMLKEVSTGYAEKVSVSQEQILSDNCTLRHTETEVADLTFYLTQ